MNGVTSASEVLEGFGDFIALLPGDSPHVGRDHELSVREESVRGAPANVSADPAHGCPVANGFIAVGGVEEESGGEAQKYI